jgi:hypothetical protein
MGAGFVWAEPGAQASVQHPVVTKGREVTPTGRQTASFAWGTIKLSNRTLPPIECVNLVFGMGVNETEPGGAGNSEKVRGYGEVMEWTATGFTNTNGGELSARCKSSSFNAWAAVEPELEKQYERVTIGEGTEKTERLAIRQVKREVPSVPWKQEAQGSEIGGSNVFYLTTGIASERTERENVEAEEALANIPTERRTGCYPQPPTTEVVREPGIVEQRETEPKLRSDPRGCIRVDITAPEIGLETPFQGTLEPKIVNGAKNGLSPSKGEFEGGCPSGCSGTSERSSERNERHLESIFGPGYTKSFLAIKELGFANEELMRLQ